MNLKEEELMEQLLSFKPMRPLFQVTVTNWKNMLFTCLVTAAKFLEDRIFFNSDIADQVDFISLEDLNTFQHIIIGMLDFDILDSTNEFPSYVKWLVVYKKFIET